MLFSPFCTRFVPDNEMWWMKVPIFLDFFPCCVGIDEGAASELPVRAVVLYAGAE